MEAAHRRLERLMSHSRNRCVGNFQNVSSALKSTFFGVKKAARQKEYLQHMSVLIRIDRNINECFTWALTVYLSVIFAEHDGPLVYRGFSGYLYTRSDCHAEVEVLLLLLSPCVPKTPLQGHCLAQGCPSKKTKNVMHSSGIPAEGAPAPRGWKAPSASPRSLGPALLEVQGWGVSVCACGEGRTQLATCQPGRHRFSTPGAAMCLFTQTVSYETFLGIPSWGRITPQEAVVVFLAFRGTYPLIYMQWLK